ncbi:DoxX family protein [Amycolatopsis albispora]|uniref:DoxX family protein n=1 Tax=Amycolatopsis albispora TaxID=1804986 RepID=A0A344L5K0_9PSEU|nr:DoxX family protein [Amycolatopsis albispora]AXB43324.1 hypothetical protein A4R43_12820 [Amycolatopsis albispora]
MPAPTSGRARQIVFRVATLAVVSELIAGSVWNLMRIEWVEVQLGHLGYPPFVAYILGVCHVAAALAIIAPGFPLLKEWAYAGVLFTWLAAVTSHLALGDGLVSWGPPLGFAVLGAVSWALRPASRRIGGDREPKVAGPRAWAVPAALVVVLYAVSFVTLPLAEDVMLRSAVDRGWIAG